MSLENRLAEMKRKKDAELVRKEAEVKTKEDERLHREEVQKRQIEVEFNRLETIAKEIIRPILDLIVKVYLDGNGKVFGVRGWCKKDNRNFAFHENNDKLTNPLQVFGYSLGWDEWGDSEETSDWGSRGGRILTVFLDKSEYFIVGGSLSHPARYTLISRIRIDNGHTQKKLEDAVCLAIENDQCKWVRSWDRTPA